MYAATYSAGRVVKPSRYDRHGHESRGERYSTGGGVDCVGSTISAAGSGGGTYLNNKSSNETVIGGIQIQIHELPQKGSKDAKRPSRIPSALSARSDFLFSLFAPLCGHVCYPPCHFGGVTRTVGSPAARRPATTPGRTPAAANRRSTNRRRVGRRPGPAPVRTRSRSRNRSSGRCA